jgi:hypothetical protein
MQRRTREIWQNLILQYERSGKSQEEFAREREIPVGTLRHWLYRVKRERAEEQAAILPVRVVASTAPTARRSEGETATVEVVVVCFRNGATSEFVAEVVSRLRRC